MKHLNKILFAVIMVVGINSHAQEVNKQWTFSFGVNAIDTKTSAGGGNGWLDQHFSQSFAVKDNWNVLPSPSFISISKDLFNNISFGVQGSINKIDKVVYFNPSAEGHDSRGYIVSNPGDLMYYGIDTTFKCSFMGLIKSKVIDPTLNFGGGYIFLGKDSYGTINPGAGVTFWFTNNKGLSFETAHKKSFGNREDQKGFIDCPSHFQHTAGFAFKFGGKDADGDGIYDKDDACPEVAGLKEFSGCPDTDGDGIIDGNDICPDVFGLVALKGCPDADVDGIADKDDRCPTVPGSKENTGCPWPDTDGDSVLDKDDKCPVANKGCPEVSKEVMIKLNEYSKTILFD